MSGLSEYERQRQENIAKNAAILNSLDLANLRNLPNKKKSSHHISKKRKIEPQEPLRRSSRFQNKQVEFKALAMDGDSDDVVEDRHEKIRPIRKLRRLPNVVNSDVDISSSSDDNNSSSDEKIEIDYSEKQPLPTVTNDGTIHFATHPQFTPNLTPKQMIKFGSFGGGFFRPIHSSITKKDYKDDYKEFPEEWYEGVDIEKYITNEEYDVEVNRYHVKAGQSLRDWEKMGWIDPIDPRGWFQWYCRFYMGRRSPDDDRQVSRWIGVCGPNGRWKKDLVSKILRSRKTWSDISVSPIVRQTLQHWGYVLTESDYNAYI